MVSQLNLFHQTSVNFRGSMLLAMSECAKASDLSREEMVERMNTLALRDGVQLLKGPGQLTMATFEKWLNPAAATHYPSVEALVVFCKILDVVEPMMAVMAPLGMKIINERQAKLLEWAELQQDMKKKRARAKKLEIEF